MKFPEFKDYYQQLISTSSISSTDSSWDEGNAEVIHKLAQWCEDLGCEVEIEEIEKGNKKSKKE